MKYKTLNRIRSIIVIFLLSLNLLGIIFLVGQAIAINEKLEIQENTKREIVNIYIVEKETVEVPNDTVRTVANAQQPSRGGSREFIITAYDNSIESQGKWVDQTATGFNLKGQSLISAKCIAVDPKVIPLGSKVELIFDDEYSHLNDIYIARDTGGAIKGKRIDLFMGDGVDKKVVTDFGKRKVKVRVLE